MTLLKKTSCLLVTTLKFKVDRVMSTTTTTTKFLGAYVAQDTIEKVDRYRANTPRSRIIESALIQFLEAHGDRKTKK
jgi:hypothetical protein